MATGCVGSATAPLAASDAVLAPSSAPLLREPWPVPPFEVGLPGRDAEWVSAACGAGHTGADEQDCDRAARPRGFQTLLLRPTRGIHTEAAGRVEGCDAALTLTGLPELRRLRFTA